jgi:hypothetical protein
MNPMNQAWNLLKAQEHMTTLRPDDAAPGNEYPQSIDPNVASMAGRYKGEHWDPDAVGDDAYDKTADRNQQRIQDAKDSHLAHREHNQAKIERLKGLAAKQAQYGKDPLNASSDRELSHGWHGTPQKTLNESMPEHTDGPLSSQMRGGEDAIRNIRSRIQRMPRPGERGGGNHVGTEDTSQTDAQEPLDPYDMRNYNNSFNQQPQQQQQLQGQRSPLQLQAPQGQ